MATEYYGYAIGGWALASAPTYSGAGLTLYAPSRSFLLGDHPSPSSVIEHPASTASLSAEAGRVLVSSVHHPASSLTLYGYPCTLKYSISGVSSGIPLSSEPGVLRGAVSRIPVTALWKMIYSAAAYSTAVLEILYAGTGQIRATHINTYSTRNTDRVRSHLSTDYCISGSVSAMHTVQYGALQAVSKTNEIRFGGLQAVSKTNEIRFGGLQAVSKTNEIRFGGLQTVSKTNEIRFGGLQTLQNILITQYGGYVVCTSVLQSLYAGTQGVSAEHSVKYSGLTNVRRHFELRYSYGVLASSVVAVEYAIKDSSTVRRTHTSFWVVPNDEPIVSGDRVRAYAYAEVP